MKKLLLLFIVPFAVMTATAQDLTQNGRINYKMEISGVEDPQVAQMFKDAGMEIGFLNGRFRFESNLPMMRVRAYSQGDSSMMLMDMMGNKMMMMVGSDQVNSRKLADDSYTVTATKETKKIAGYTATKYIVKTKDGQTFNVYATDKLPMKLAEYSPYTKIKGAPLEYDMTQGPYTVRVTATDVKAGAESEETFRYDTTGYTRMSAEQLKRMFGGAQQHHDHDHNDPNHRH